MKIKLRDVYIVDGVRSPFLKAQGQPGQFSASDIAVQTCKSLLAKQPIQLTDIDEIITGCMLPSPDEANIARVIGLRLSCPESMPAYTVQRNCASGLQALDDAMKDIQIGRHDIVLAGGVDVMSRAPLLFNDGMVKWFSKQFKARRMSQKLQNLVKFKLKFLKPEIALLKGLTDPKSGMSMGQTAEELAYLFHISRHEMDQFAVDSHARALQADLDKRFFYRQPLYGQDGKSYQVDDGVRSDSTLNKLARLKPFFDKKFGLVTPANSSQITDGACFLLLASEEAVARHKLNVIGKINAINWAGVKPEIMGIGPVHACAQLLQEQKMKLNDIDYFEINEAFSAQVIACVRAMNDPSYCRDKLGLDKPLGLIPPERLNVYGGAISLGHPVGASGARIVLQLLHILHDTKSTKGLASLCVGGGQGGAVLVEAVGDRL